MPDQQFKIKLESKLKDLIEICEQQQKVCLTNNETPIRIASEIQVIDQYIEVIKQAIDKIEYTN